MLTSGPQRRGHGALATFVRSPADFGELKSTFSCLSSVSASSQGKRGPLMSKFNAQTLDLYLR